MPHFEWEGRHSNGLPAAGRMTADSKEQVVAFLRTQGIRAEWLQMTATGMTGAMARPGRPDARAARKILFAAFAVGMLLILAVPFLSVIF